MGPVSPQFTTDELVAMENHFHSIIRSYVTEFLGSMPELTFPTIDNSMPVSEAGRSVFLVKGMYGGFGYWFEVDGPTPKLIVEGFCRVCEGSERIYEISPTCVRRR